MPASTPTRRRAAAAALAVSVASLAGAGSAAALPLPSILQGALPGIGVTPASITVTTPGAYVTPPAADLTIPDLKVDRIVVESLRLPEIVAEVRAAVAAQAEAGVAVPSMKLPSVSTPVTVKVRASSGRTKLAARLVGSVTTPSRTPALKAKAKVRVDVKAAANARVKLPRTPRIRIATPAVQLLEAGRVAVAAKAVAVASSTLSVR